MQMEEQMNLKFLCTFPPHRQSHLQFRISVVGNCSLQIYGQSENDEDMLP